MLLHNPHYAGYSFPQFLHIYLNHKLKDFSVKAGTKRTYKVRTQQIERFIIHYELHNAPPEIFAHPSTLENLIRFFLVALQFSHETVRKLQLYFLEILGEYRLYFPQIIVPKPVKLPRREAKEFTYLDESELQMIAVHQFRSDRLQRVADLFLIQCYTGISYVDLNQINRNNVISSGKYQVIIGRRQKTGTVFKVPMIAQVRRIVNKYNWTLPQISNQKYNAYIKEIAEIVGIEKPITTYTARRTAAMYYLEKTGTYEVPAQVLGHSSTAITEKYYAQYSLKNFIANLNRSGLLD